jgi:hypothetical protein
VSLLAHALAQVLADLEEELGRICVTPGSSLSGSTQQQQQAASSSAGVDRLRELLERECLEIQAARAKVCVTGEWQAMLMVMQHGGHHDATFTCSLQHMLGNANLCLECINSSNPDRGVEACARALSNIHWQGMRSRFPGTASLL